MKKSLLIAFFALCYFSARPGFAQNTVTGAFEGTVKHSQTGEPLAGATAEIINLETNATISKRTDARGRFYQGLLAPGLYRIRVSLQGFQTQEVIQRLEVASTGEVVPVPVSLDPVTVVAAPPPPPTQPTPTPTVAARPQAAARALQSAAVASEIRAEINTTDARRSFSFNETKVSGLPLGGVTVTRTFDELALLLPGIAPPPQTLGTVAGPGQGAGVGTAGQFSVNGLRSRANNFTVDGSDNNDEDIGVRRQGFTALIPQSIESVSGYQAFALLAPAQYGRNFGGIVNAVSKSGGNQAHGSLYGFFNSSQLNSHNFFDTTNGTDESELRGGNNQRVIVRRLGAGGTLIEEILKTRNQSGGEDSFTFGRVGATLGGPLRAGSTFYFFSFEGQKINARQEESFAVPTVEERGLLRSGASGLAQDPFTGALQNRRPVGFNAPIIFSLFPFANNPQGVYGRNTFTQSLPASARGAIASAKLDHNFKIAERAQSVTGRYNFTDDWRTIPVTGGALFSTLRPFVRTQNFSLFFNSDVNAPNAATVKNNQVRLSYGRTRLRFDEVRDTQFLRPARAPFLLNAPVITNRITPVGEPNRDILYTGDREEFDSLFPLGQVIVAGFSPIGVDVYNFPQSRVNNTYQVADIFTVRKGDHTLAFGADHRRSDLNSDLPRVARPLVVFNGGPRLIANADGSFRLPDARDRIPFLSPADLVALDAPSSFFLTLNSAGGDAAISLRYYQHNVFAQDVWRITLPLSLSFGLRYEYNTPPRELNQRIERTFNDQALSQAPGLQRFVGGRTSIFEPDRNNFAPRVGLAYAPNTKRRNWLTVFRAGYGLFYDQALGAVVSQSRNVFPTFLTLNFGGLRASGSNQTLTFLNPAQTNINAQVPIVRTGTVNQLNPQLSVNGLLQYLNGSGTPGAQPFPDALGLTLPTKELPMPLAHHYSVAVEQQFNANLSFNAAYVGTLGRKLLRFTTPNLGAGATVAALRLNDGGVPSLFGRFIAPRRPVSGAGSVNLFETNATSRYDSLQLQARGSHSQRGLQYQFTYTFARADDDVSDVFDLAGAFVLPQNSLALPSERGAANFHLRQRFTYYFLYDLSKLSEGARWLLDGLQLTGTGQVQSGQPFTVNSLFDINLDGNPTDRLNTLNGLLLTHDRRQPLLLQTADTFSLLAPIGQDGQIARNTFRASSAVLFDLSVSKRFDFGSSQQLSLRADIFNLFNRANFGVPVRFLEAPGFGQATRTVTPARLLQFSLKYEF